MIEKGLPEEAKQYIRDNHKGVAPKEMAKRLTEMYGEVCTYQKVRAYYKNHKFRSGVSSQFKKGHPSPNKGKHIRVHHACQ